jgi:hypothetical protein
MKKDIQQKLVKFSEILGNLNTFKPTLFQKSLGINVYNALTLPILLYGSAIWTLGKKIRKQLTSIEKTLFRTGRHTFFYH